MTQTVYHRTTFEERRNIERLERSAITELQLEKLGTLIDAILPENKFYAAKLGRNAQSPTSIEELAKLPETTKQELVARSSTEGFAANLTYPTQEYSRFHRTSGTSGRPMIVLDTAEDWQWWMETWQYVLDAASLTADDRVLMAFSFGPFIGFWSAFDAAVERGAMVVPTGGMGTAARLDLIKSLNSTIVFCTPSYAIHMAEVAETNNVAISESAVEKIIVAGEPGGSLPSVRNKIETAWGASVVDHSGASEVGPWGFADASGKGIFVNEAQFIAEFLSIENGKPSADGELSELLLTSLGRHGSPVIRYKTGDLVRPRWNADANCNFVLLEGGVLGRTDDMMIIRGVNVFPTSIEQILRSFPEINEFRMTAFKDGALDQLKIEIEDEASDPERVKSELQLRLGFRVDVQCVPANSLPRFEAKGKRFIDER